MCLHAPSLHGSEKPNGIRFKFRLPPYWGRTYELICIKLSGVKRCLELHQVGNTQLEKASVDWFRKVCTMCGPRSTASRYASPARRRTGFSGSQASMHSPHWPSLRGGTYRYFSDSTCGREQRIEEHHKNTMSATGLALLKMSNVHTNYDASRSKRK